MFSKTKSPSAWNGSLNPPRCVMYATAGIANANPAATAISARRSATIKVFSRNVSLIAAKTARCVVATPTPVRALHATNNANTVDARKPNCGTTPNDKPPAPCKNNPTTISATRPFSTSAAPTALNACDAKTAARANEPNATPAYVAS